MFIYDKFFVSRVCAIIIIKITRTRENRRWWKKNIPSNILYRYKRKLLTCNVRDKKKYSNVYIIITSETNLRCCEVIVFYIQYLFIILYKHKTITNWISKGEEKSVSSQWKLHNIFNAARTIVSLYRRRVFFLHFFHLNTFNNCFQRVTILRRPVSRVW